MEDPSDSLDGDELEEENAIPVSSLHVCIV